MPHFVRRFAAAYRAQIEHFVECWHSHRAAVSRRCGCPGGIRNRPGGHRSVANRAAQSESRCCMPSEKRLTMAQALIALPQAAVRRARRRASSRSSPAASASSATAIIAGIGQALQQIPEFRYYQARNEQALVHIADQLRQDEEPPADVRLHVVDRPGRDQHAHRRGDRHRSTACRCCCCRAISSPAATSRRSCSSWSPSTRRTSRSTIASSRSAATGTASTARSNC